MKKLASIILILAMILGSAVPLFAAETETVKDKDGNDATAYITFDVEAPHGSIVKIEPCDYKGNGIIDNTGKVTGEFGPAEFSDQIETFFKVDPRTYLEPGDYYYKVTLKDKGAANVEYDKSEYIIWVYIDYNPANTSQKRLSIVIQKDNDNEKPLGIKFENCLVVTRTFKRIITYTEITTDGKVVHTQVEETVVLQTRVRCDSDGNPIDKDGNTISLTDEDKLIYIGENGNPLGFDTDGRPYLQDENGNPVLDTEGNKTYTTKWTIKSVSPASRAQTPVAIGADGKATVTTVLATPPHSDPSLWTPDKASVGAWVIDLNNPPPDGSVEKIPVVYTKAAEPEKPGGIVKTGDLLNPVLWGIILTVAVVAMVIILILRRKKK